MSIFHKKTCPICSGKLGILSYRLAKGEKICPACEKLLRGKFDLIRQGAAFHDTLNELDLYQAKQMITEMKTIQRDDIARFGTVCHGIMSVWDTFAVPSIGLEESGEEIAALCGKPVVLGFCEYGIFTQGDSVWIQSGNHEQKAQILRLIPCTGAYPFIEELFAGVHKTECTANTNAWLIFDLEENAVETKMKIIKK